ncbi:endoplasmic reticulum aminopeptidase 1-like isoform X2 [Stegodyphus dumicola]|uniref:endoplasmic reticulum aminopeptidase 1-like isoform X2 n=1 Tax=Stegodyphus dumicola TaxID=202533 RepID=UPI0015AA05D0|nr:endoplasmic reticulum aminopeptidase 1-like isoform X2 [Stegodyphus dumicola]
MMNEPEVDDVAFLTGENAKKQVLYTDNSGPDKIRRVVCSKQQAFCVTAIVLSSLLLIAMVASFARPIPRCPVVTVLPDFGHTTPASTKQVPKAKTGEIFPWHDIRLPPFIMPVHYSLFMHPNLETFENSGSVNITFQVTMQTNFIVLHSKELNLSRTAILEGDEKGIPITQRLEYPKHEQLYIEVDGTLKPYREYTLWIDFRKHLEEKLEGFYISSYKSSGGQKRYLATTHFEPTAARSAFPCFDEPAMKATFQLTIVHDEDHNAYFNSEVSQTAPYGNGLSITVFDKTLRMSTYLVAFVVCDFKPRQTTNPDGINVRVLVPPEQYEQAEFALETAANVLHFYQMFFNVSYPLPKLDMIAIPDFGPGAMENWGLVTFRMTTILYNPSETSSESQEHVATVIAHELAHQWFGDLVTMQWWSDLWLNEGFASFMEYLGTNHVEPKWKMMDQFIVSTTQDAMSLDSLESSHPVMTDVDDPVEIEAIFDAISYKKGAAILYMLENFLGMETLKKGLSVYLNKYRFKNARTEELWDAFTQVALTTAHLNVSKIMDTWTRQKGYPLIMVTFNHPHVRIRQRRFLLTPPEYDDATPSDLSPYGYKWFVPVTYITDLSNKENLYWLNMSDGEFLLPARAKWLKLNINQTGFYRVMYDDGLWNTLINILHSNHKVFKPADRANLLDDALTLSRVGILDSALALNLTRYLEKEEDYVPWETAILQLEVLDVLMQESPALSLFQKYVMKLLKPVVSALGWQDKGDHLEKKLRSAVLVTSMRFHNEETISRAKQLFQDWMQQHEKVPPNLRNVVYAAGVKYGSKEEWQFCWKQYQETQVPSEKRLLLTALGNTQDMWQLSQYLNYSLDKNKIRPQDTTLVIAVAARNPVGRLLTWRFVRMNWPQLLETFGQGSFSMDMIISEAISHFSSKFDYDEVKNFFSGVEVGPGMQSLQQSLERIRANIRWRENTEASVIQWLQKNVNFT